MAKTITKGYLNATEVADYLVTKGMAFRDAHRCTGEVVRFAVEQGKELHELSLDELEPFSKLFREDIFDLLTPEQMVNRRLSKGGTATENVIAAIQKAMQALDQEVAKRKP